MAIKTLYIGNMPHAASESELKTHFSNYECSRVRIIEGRGFAFLDIDSDQLQTAISEMDGKPLNGRNLTVSEANPKKPRSNGDYDDRGSMGGRTDGGFVRRDR